MCIFSDYNFQKVNYISYLYMIPKDYETIIKKREYKCCYREFYSNTFTYLLKLISSLLLLQKKETIKSSELPL